MGGCLIRDNFEVKEDRIYKNILIDAHFGQFDHNCEGMAILNMDVNPIKTRLMDEFENANQARMSLQIGETEEDKPIMSTFTKIKIRNTKYLIHHQIPDYDLTREALLNEYLNVFNAVNQNKISQLLILDFFFDQKFNKVNKKVHAELLFQAIFNFIDQTQDACLRHFIIRGTNFNNAVILVDTFLTIYNTQQPLPPSEIIEGVPAE